RLRDLRRGSADPAGTTIDEERAARGHTQQPQHALSRLANHAGCCCNGPIHRRRLVSPCIEDRVLRLCEGALTQHIVPDHHTAHPFSYFVNNPSGVVAQITGAFQRLALRVHSRPVLPVSWIDACRPHHDANLSWSRMRFGRLAQPDDLRPAELGELKRKHLAPPSLTRSITHAQEILAWAISSRPLPSRCHSRGRPQKPPAAPQHGPPSSFASCPLSAFRAAFAFV